VENYYREVLTAINAEDLLRPASKSALENALKTDILKTIFYSSSIEGNLLDIDTSELLLNGYMVNREGMFQDYIEIINHGDTTKKIIDFSNRALEKEDAVEIRKALFNGIYGKYYGFRRYRNSIDGFVTISTEELPKALDSVVAILNRNPSSNIDAFLNATEFHLRFVNLHPFEDGVGRTTRLLTNLYLLKSGLNLFYVKNEDKAQYVIGLPPYHFSGYESGFVYNTLLLLLNEQNREMLIGRAKKIESKDIHMIEFKHIILNKSKDGEDPFTLKRDINYLYDYGVKNDTKMVLAALYLSAINKIESDFVLKTVKDADPKVRAMSLWAMRMLDGEKFIDNFKDAATNDPSPYVRMFSLLSLCKLGKLDQPIINEIISAEKDEGVLRAAGSYMTWNTVKKGDFVNVNLEKFIYDNSISIRYGFVGAFINHRSNREIIDKLLNKIETEHPVIKHTIITQLEHTDKLNNPDIARILAAAAAKDKDLRTLLLGHLSIPQNKNKEISSISDEYIGLFDKIMSSTEYNATERAYVIYISGKKYGYDYINKKYKFEIDPNNTTLENIALLLVKNNESGDRNVVEVFDIEDNKFNLVQLMTLNKLIKQERYTKNFLSLCSMKLKRWQIASQISL
jgi:hypothetical protein